MERDQAVESAVVFWDLEEKYFLVSIISHRMEEYLSSRVGAFMLDVWSQERDRLEEKGSKCLSCHGCFLLPECKFATSADPSFSNFFEFF